MIVYPDVKFAAFVGYFHHGAYLQNATKLVSNYGTGTSSMYANRNFDMIAQYINTMIMSEPGFQSEYDNLNTTELISEAPLRRRYDLTQDYNAYGNRIALLDSFLDGDLSLDRPGPGENRTSHFSLKGEAYAEGAKSYLKSVTTRSIYGATFPLYRYEGCPKTIDGQGFPSGATIGAASVTDYRDGILQYLSETLPGSRLPDTGGYAGSYTDVRSFSYSDDGGSLRINYVYRTHRVGASTALYDEATIETEFTLYRNPGYQYFNSLGYRAYTPGLIIISDRFLDDDHTSYVSWVGRWGHGRPYMKYSGYCYGLPSLYHAGGGNSINSVDIANVIFQRERDMLRYIHVPDLLDSAYMSAFQAFEIAKESIDSNYVEALSELDQTIGLFSKGTQEKLTAMIATIPVGSFTRRAMRFANYFADAVLLTSFGLLPLYNDIVNLGEVWDRTIDKGLELLSVPVTAYGAYSTTFESGPLQGYTLVTRTELRIGAHEENLVLAFIRLSSVGIAPTPSALWDLLPFSFVIDWATNMSSRISLMEGYVYALLLRVYYCVHTYTLTKPAGEVDSISGLVYPPTAQLRFFEREVSRFYPCPKSAHDWASYQNIPVLAGGSLAWTMIRP